MSKTSSTRIAFSNVNPYDVAGMRKNAAVIKAQISNSEDFKPSDSTLIKFSTKDSVQQHGAKKANGNR